MMICAFLQFRGGSNKAVSVVGLDVGTQTVKAVKLKISKEGVLLEDVYSWPALSDLKSNLNNLGAKRINTSVSGQATVIRYVNFPQMNASEIKQALRFEAQKHIPFPLEEVNLDTYILTRQAADNKMLVMLAAAKKEFLNLRLKLIEDLGFRVNVIDLDSIAMINAFNFNYSQEANQKNKSVALLNIGASFSNLSILEAGLPHLSRDIHIAGNNFTQKISDVVGLKQEQAEELKLNPQGERLNKISAAVESALSALAAELRTSFDYYESQSSSSVGKIFLSGAGSIFPAVKDTLANLLGIEVGFWDPFRNIKIVGKELTDKIKSPSCKFAVATGLALRG